MNDGMIAPGEAPASWGFTADRFTADSYLWREGKRVMISFIETKSKGKGHFSTLVKAIEADGLVVDVPTPLGQMQRILERWGWKSRQFEDVTVWSRDSEERE
jgi:hypothetical protein